MTHQDIDQQEIVEGYVRNKLTPERRLAFEEHFFACDECFDKVQSAERFVTGVRYAAEAGLLAREVPRPPTGKASSFWAASLKPAMAVSAAVSVALAGVLAWLLLYRTPQLRAELARERDQHERIRQENQEKLDRTSEELNSEIGRRAELQKQLADLQAFNRPGLPTQPEANTPWLLLQTERSSQAPIPVIIPSGARFLVLLSEPGPGAGFGSYRIEVDSASQKRVLAVEGLKKNAEGMLSASVPASALANGTYLVRLYGVVQGRTELAGEYRISVRKK